MKLRNCPWCHDPIEPVDHNGKPLPKYLYDRRKTCPKTECRSEQMRHTARLNGLVMGRRPTPKVREVSAFDLFV